MPRKLDRNAHFGTCWGVTGGIAYEQVQDGKLMQFDINGMPIDKKGRVLKIDDEPDAPVAVKAPVEEDDDVNAELPDPTDVPLDLTAYANGEIKAAWPTVVHNFYRKYGRYPANKKDVIETALKAFMVGNPGEE